MLSDLNRHRDGSACRRVTTLLPRTARLEFGRTLPHTREDTRALSARTMSFTGDPTMFLVLFLHIAAMFTAVALTVGPGVVLVVAHRTGKLAEVGPPIARLRVARAAVGSFALGGVLGLATALAFGYSLTAPWLLLAYAGFTVASLIGVFVSAPVARRLMGADDLDAGDLDAIGRAVELDLAANAAILALLVADMVFKPLT